MWKKYAPHRYHAIMKRRSNVSNAEREKPGPCLSGGADEFRVIAPALCFLTLKNGWTLHYEVGVTFMT